MPKGALKKYFGFDEFKNGQKAVIDKILAGQSAGSIFPTGAGKSLCYQLPALMLRDMTLVVSPLLSLMKDQLDFLTSQGIPAARLDSTLDRETVNRIFDDAKTGRLKILMVSVERFKNERFRYHLQNMRVSLMAIDEAHCISEWGHNFRPEYLNLPRYQKEFGIPQVLLLTATAPPAVIDDMCEKFAIARDNVVVTGFYRSNLFLKVTPTAESEKKTWLLHQIQKAPDAPTIVYVTLQKTAQTVAEFLQSHGIQAHAYHAGMQNNDRETIQNRFMAGGIACIVATIAFGMGIDKKDIRRIIHYDLPKSLENYSQEIGRAGRDGNVSLCEVLANLDGVTVLENFIYGDTPDKDAILQLVSIIRQNERFVWEFKLSRLSHALNIRVLPLKTLLVYLAMEGIIRPRATYFDEYAFKLMADPASIVEKFTGERQQFVSAILSHCHTRKIWTTVDIDAIEKAYPAERRRITAALEYFDEKGLIELRTRQSVEVYDILNQAFDPDAVAEKMHRLFVHKESHGIRRIHQMVAFFQTRTCISRALAAYFGEHLEKENCGHCSFCKNGPVSLKLSGAAQPLHDHNFKALTRDFLKACENQSNASALARFLCGITTPGFSQYKVNAIPNFGALTRYPYPEVRKWASENLAAR